MKLRIIYDFGANNGDDIDYYLLKADRVVAVEANPFLCEQIRNRFPAAVRAGRLVVENCVVVDEGGGEARDFHLHKVKHWRSQFPPPPPDQAADFETVRLPAKEVCRILREHGEPHYVKVDIEHFDAPILRALFRGGYFPPYISAEAHTLEVLAVLVDLGGYNAFKLVEGHRVATEYADCLIRRHPDGEKVRISFPHHAAGPFGEDVIGGWMPFRSFLHVLALEGLGWKDIHACRRQPGDDTPTWLFRDYLRRRVLPRTAPAWLGGMLIRKVRGNAP